MSEGFFFFFFSSSSFKKDHRETASTSTITTHPRLALGGPRAHRARLLGGDRRRGEGNDVAAADGGGGVRKDPHEQPLDRGQRRARCRCRCRCRCRRYCSSSRCCCCRGGLFLGGRRGRSGRSGVEHRGHCASGMVDDPRQPRGEHRGDAGADGFREGLSCLCRSRGDGHGVDIAGLFFFSSSQRI